MKYIKSFQKDYCGSNMVQRWQYCGLLRYNWSTGYLCSLYVQNMSWYFKCLFDVLKSFGLKMSSPAGVIHRVMQMNLIKTFFTGMDCNAFYVIISFHPELFVSYSNLFMYLPSVNLLQTIQFVSELLSEWFRRNRQPNQKIWLFKKNRLKIVIRSLVLIIHVRQKIRDTRHHWWNIVSDSVSHSVYGNIYRQTRIFA